MGTGKKSLILGGGSIKGAFQVGAVVELLKAGYEPDNIHGISIGSLNGAFLAAHAAQHTKNGRPDWIKIADHLEQFWSEIDSFEDMGHLKHAGELAFDMTWEGGFISLLNIDKFKDYIKRWINPKSLRESEVRFTAGCVNIADGQMYYANNQFPNLIDYVIASASLPFLMPLRQIGAASYVDGGLRCVLPVSQLRDDGSDTAVCISCQAPTLSVPTFNYKDLFKLCEQVMDIVVHQNSMRDMELIEQIRHYTPETGEPAVSGPIKGFRRVKIVTIQPEVNPALSMLDFDQKQIRDLIHVGKTAATVAMRQQGLFSYA